MSEREGERPSEPTVKLSGSVTQVDDNSQLSMRVSRLLA